MTMKPYTVDFASQTITITSAFAQEMTTPGSEAYETVRQLHQDFPELRIVKRTHRTPNRYTSKQGDVSACNPYKNLTYDRMEQFISALPNSTEYLEQYNFLKRTASAVQTNGYSIVRNWFVAQFPLYRKEPLFYLTGEPTIISGVDFLKKQETMKQGA